MVFCMALYDNLTSEKVWDFFSLFLTHAGHSTYRPRSQVRQSALIPTTTLFLTAAHLHVITMFYITVLYNKWIYFLNFFPHCVQQLTWGLLFYHQEFCSLICSNIVKSCFNMFTYVGYASRGSVKLSYVSTSFNPLRNLGSFFTHHQFLKFIPEISI